MASVAALVGVALWITRATPGARSARAAVIEQHESISLASAPTMGEASAPVAMVVFSDFQCPFCRVFARSTMPVVIDRYVRSGRLTITFRHFPLDNLHPDARHAAELAECARQQGRFWQMHDAIFERSARAGAGWLDAAAAQAGVKAEGMTACVAAAADRVRDDAALALKLNITATPTVLLGYRTAGDVVNASRVLKGATSPDDIGREIDSLLANGKAR